MPKQVDHEERRRHIAGAVLRLIGTRGMEAATLRAVAAEAGVSMGAVQHYFKAKEEMVLFAMEHNQALLAVRVQKRFAEPPSSARGRFRLFIRELLPLEEESLAGARLYAALQARAVIDPAIAALAVQAVEGLTGFFRTQLEEVRERGEARADLDADREARSLYSTVSGLVVPLMLGAYTEERAMEVLDAHLERLFG
ncbi:TetR/AcrR family transcriptional regulator [Actinocorallia aurantiaca]|uniref:TetR/AcrR family transcriptional regulator n=1 Tax=Actinocorallia aurantiaca TaxID=46204 RepID=A0ABN3U016_9ACTN